MESAGRPLPSVMDPAEIPLADVYAGAALDLARADAEAEALAAELADLARLLREQGELDRLLFRAPMSVSARCRLVDKLFHGRCGPVTDGLLGVLARRDRLVLLPLIAHRFRFLLDRREGKVEVTVTTAVPMDGPARQRVIETMTRQLGAAPSLRERVDPGLVGGMVVSVAGKVYDDSIQGELTRMREAMLASIARKQAGKT
jgi:F-type H+-transporting ATPase subunit delta